MLLFGSDHHPVGDTLGVWGIEQPRASDSRDRGGTIRGVRQLVGFRLIGLSL